MFVDECHRTQSGKLHEAMKVDSAGCHIYRFYRHAIDEKGQEEIVEVFGPYIHTYKFDEAVADGVVLDYAMKRVISTSTSARKKVDEWFEAKTTRPVNESPKPSSTSDGGLCKKSVQQDAIAANRSDMLMDMETQAALKTVTETPCWYAAAFIRLVRFMRFQPDGFGGKVAIITSFTSLPLPANKG